MPATAQQIVIVTGGGALAPRAAAEIRPDSLVIAADSGLDHALAAGITPQILVGDLDSISPGGRSWAVAAASEVRQFPADKDATDTELALDTAAQVAGAAADRPEMLLLAGDGDRLDHTLGTLGALGRAAFGFGACRALLGSAAIHIVTPGRPIDLALAGATTFSVLCLHGPCRGVTIGGARWPLDRADLDAGSTHGVSNLGGLPDRPVTISVTSGILTVVIP